MKYILVKAKGVGNIVSVIISHITHIEQYDDGCRIYVIGGAYIVTTTGSVEVKEMIERAEKEGK